MLVLLIVLVSMLYLSQIIPFLVFSESISIIVVALTLILPLANIVYAIIFSKRISNNAEKVKKWNQNVLIIKIVLIPFYIINFILWFCVSILGIVPTFMFLLAAAPIGITFTYWVFLSTSAYSVTVIREYYKSGYLTKSLQVGLIISQFLFVWDLVGFIVLQFMIKNRGELVQKLNSNP